MLIKTTEQCLTHFCPFSVKALFHDTQLLVFGFVVMRDRKYSVQMKGLAFEGDTTFTSCGKKWRMTFLLLQLLWCSLLWWGAQPLFFWKVLRHSGKPSRDGFPVMFAACFDTSQFVAPSGKFWLLQINPLPTCNYQLGGWREQFSQSAVCIWDNANAAWAWRSEAGPISPPFKTGSRKLPFDLVDWSSLRALQWSGLVENVDALNSSFICLM